VAGGGALALPLLEEHELVLAHGGAVALLGGAPQPADGIVLRKTTDFAEWARSVPNEAWPEGQEKDVTGLETEVSGLQPQ
jgi:hypothetical protein